MNMFINTINSTLAKITTKEFPQKFLFLLTGFLVSLFFLLNILYSQHPQGGWVTPFGNINTFSLIIVTLLAIITCLIVLWRSATSSVTTASPTKVKVAHTNRYSKPSTFMSVSPE